MSNYNDARSMALLYYKKFMTQTTDENEAIYKAAEQSITFYSDVSVNELVKDLQESLNIGVTLPSMLTSKNDSEHIPWWNIKKGELKLTFWHRYERYLLEKKHWPLKVVQSLDETTDKILDILEDPTDTTRIYDRRGLVIGYVQSGKTANYTALINKAIDAGFKLIIVLSGMHNDLRSQTQMRLDEEVLGFETSTTQLRQPNEVLAKLIGVSTLPGEKFVNIGTLTTRDNSGDFSRKIARNINVHPGMQPFILVVKKNVSVLQNILNYYRNDSPLAHLATPSAQYKTVPGIPLLLIDDEADQASVNTADIYDDDGNIMEDYHPSKINGLIRQIYYTFDQKAYIGYTATPFANIFIHNEANSGLYGSELFPKDFILGLPKPANYIGPAELFGLNKDDDTYMPLISMVNYDNDFVPAQHKSNHTPSALPDTLIEAIYSFILTTSARRARGQRNVHNSMLIHVTRFNSVQNIVYEMVKDVFYDIKRRVKYGEPNSNNNVKLALKKLWVSNYCTTSEYMKENFSELVGDVSIPSWEDIEKELVPTLESIIVKEINGSSGDALDYKEHETTGLNVIAIGGDKLSRGLTLEGLTVSYYLRASRMYDTLMQMGRWFGYRPGYLDLCRIYTTPDLASWFRHIAIATEELRDSLHYMDSIKATPEEFGLKIQTHPIMYITSQVKMQSGTVQRLSYKNTVSETTVFEIDDSFFDNNFMATDQFIRSLGQPVEDYLIKKGRSHAKAEHLFWENVTGDYIIEYLSKYKTAKTAPRANSEYLRRYIEAQMQNDELVRWTVVLINTGNEPGFRLGGHDIKSGIERKGIEDDRRGKRVSVKRLMSADHEYLDFSMEQHRRVLEIKKSAKNPDDEKTKSEQIRAQLRSPEEGLLLIYPIDRKETELLKTASQVPIGIALVFPDSGNDTSVEYAVNNVFMEMEQND
ncbi:Z1 domain-containing protein [Ruminiclostridium cellobioparum]|uniref:Z1 domain-containing protein n=1 Tax=Ruminiclostridium cellobioparum subsp. termitidis CT1112 TaxID=1195236 RepID=S0FQ62_RUMCE|nr:Z1 domain-containing protein [Ruminiclostridium cellobioparum]EMS70633.1 Z1 domain-containing protein [Ruminiclostridium cellobioparum subsp. termitidis CT1112]